MTRVEQHGVSGGRAVADNRVDFRYNAAGQFDAITRYANLLGTQVVATSDYSYDQAGRLTALRHRQGATTLAAHAWTFDSAGRMTGYEGGWRNASGVWAGESTSYANDATGQLTAADHAQQADESYQYDANGNRTGGGYVAGPDNRLRSDGMYRYDYDDEGNRTKRYVWTDANANGQVEAGERSDIVEYAWDHRNRLVAVTTRAAEGGPATATVAYAYDAFDRLIARSADADGAGSQAARDAYFAYDGAQRVAEVWREGEGPAAVALRRYLWGPAADQVFAEDFLAAGGSESQVRWALADHLGTVWDVAEYDAATGTTTIVNHRAFDSFGRVLSETNALVAFAFSFAAQARDPLTGMQNHWHRWYDPATGGWASEDPSGLSPDANPARYCRNCPLTQSDSSGLAAGAATVLGYIKSAKDARKQVHRELGRLGELAKCGAGEEEVQAQHERIEAAYGKYYDYVEGISRQMAGLSMTDPQYSAAVDGYAGLSYPLPALQGREGDAARLRRLGRAVAATGEAMHEQHEYLDSAVTNLKRAETAADLISTVGGAGMVGKKLGEVALKQGFKAAMKWAAAGAASYAAGQAADRAFGAAVSWATDLAREAGVSEEVFMLGVIAYHTYSSARALQGSRPPSDPTCFVAGTQVVVVEAGQAVVGHAADDGPSLASRWGSVALCGAAAGLIVLESRGRHAKRGVPGRQGRSSQGMGHNASCRAGGEACPVPASAGTTGDHVCLSSEADRRADRPIPARNRADATRCGTSASAQDHGVEHLHRGRSRLLRFALPLLLLLGAVALWRSGGERPFAADSAGLCATATRNIERLQPGDWVLATDPASGATAPKRVTHVFRRESDHVRLLGVRAADGALQEIETTDEHPFWSLARGWTAARDLVVGDHLSQTDGALATVVSTRRVEYPSGIAVYNVETEDFHTYYVQAHGSRAPPLLVHNCTRPLAPAKTAPSPAPAPSAAARAPANVVDKSWKLKIQGTAQKTGTPGHQFRSYREAIAEAKNPSVRSVHLDHGYNRGLGLDPKTIQPNRRPDVLSLYNDSSVVRIEVQSRTNNPLDLRARNAALDAQLRAQGFAPTPPRVVQPTTTP